MKKKILIATILFLVFTVWKLDKIFDLFPNKDSDTYASGVVNQAICEKIMQPNKWGYIVSPDHWALEDFFACGGE